MSRSPLAYPLTRGIDGDAGGAADLQTDIMRFMAILSLCLMAIFALVQSLPMTAVPAPAAAIEPPVSSEIEPAPPPPIVKPPEPVHEHPKAASVKPVARPVVPKPSPARPASAAEPSPQPAAPAAPAQEERGFTLRFASDQALTRLVARGDIGFYALADSGARQLAVRESQLRFWSSRRPAAFHEMERSTVPAPVIDALGLAGAELEAIRWGVTLPGQLSTDLARLMREHSGGSLVIDANGSLHREAS